MNIGSAIRLYESYAKRAVLPRLRPGLRIVHVAPPWIEVPPIKYGGTEVVVERVAIGQQELGLNVAVLCRPGSTVPGAVHLARAEWTAERERYHEAQYAYLVGLSQYHGQELMDLVGPSRCAGIVYNPLPGDVFSAPSVRRADYTTYAARIHPDKRQDLTVRVALRAGVRLILIGKVSEDTAFYEQQVLPLVDGHKVIYLGEVSNKIRDRYLAHSSFSLAPIQWNEPNGIGHTLAASLGAPVVYFNRGALAETLWDGVAGIRVPPDDLDAMVEAIPYARALNADRCSLVTLARFNYRRAAVGYAELYADVLQGMHRYGVLYPEISEYDIVQPILS